MKNKFIFLFMMLIIPILSWAQFELDVSFSSGFSKTYDKRGGSPVSDKFGLSYKGGFETNYIFKSGFGIGTGLLYSYTESTWIISIDHDRSSNAISIPFNIFYQFGSSKFEFLLGTTANINLNKGFRLNINSKEEYKPLYMNLQAGGFYHLSKTLKLGIITNVGITPYFEYTILNAVPEYGTPINKYFLRSVSLKLSYI